MYTHKNNTKGSDKIGAQAETLFEKLAREHGWLITKATRIQDYKEHWDYVVKRNDEVYHIEVKGLKRTFRRATQDDRMICIELQGNTGYPGWLYGKASHIAFLMREGFVLVDRKKLIEKVESLVDINGKINPSIPKKELHTIYRRVKFNHIDKIIYITKEELLTVPHKTWEAEDV